ncbi:hypothetical protein V2W30_33250 [Streptomyces sp. Q6]|uniref:Uncharacterized protein n=1 Tax=Streptomyces citrinus TaxID=3118173 RepID=A0ACD5AKI9_9ACTN
MPSRKHSSPTLTVSKPGVRSRTATKKIKQYRAALDSGADPTLVTGWITETTARKEAAQRKLAKIAGTAGRTFTEEEITKIVRELGQIGDLIHRTPVPGKTKLYTNLGVTLRHNARTRAMTFQSRPALHMYVFQCPRGDLNPHAR